MATAAASTALMAMFAVTDFPFDAVQTMFVVAMFWGTAMGIANRGFLRLRWSAREPIAEPERA
jgi:hypothetical protein